MSKEKKHGCCNDKQTTIQLKKDQLAANINWLPQNLFVFIQRTYPSLIQLLFREKDVITTTAHRPPLIQTVSSCILHCVFRV
jgi:hypothetical protein